MVDQDVRFGELQLEQRAAEKRRRRVFFWIISGALILFVLWFLTLPALVYDMDRPERPPMRRGVP